MLQLAAAGTHSILYQPLRCGSGRRPIFVVWDAVSIHKLNRRKNKIENLIVLYSLFVNFIVDISWYRFEARIKMNEKKNCGIN